MTGDVETGGFGQALLTCLKRERVRMQLTASDQFMGLMGRSQPMLKIFRIIQTVTNSSATVLITGESGTGKEVVARAIHFAGQYKNKAFIPAYCSSFAPTLVHSEIFGHEKGAFTGAIGRKLGRLERAHGGILFLDEVADLKPEIQALLLRFLQNKSFERVGGEELLEVDVRVIAATSKNIEKEVEEGSVRGDLYYRLNVIQISLPPLRKRITDLPLLANHFLKTYCLMEGKDIKGFDIDAINLMTSYHWPGNVRELENMVARAVVLASSDRIGAELLPEKVRMMEWAAEEFSLSKNESRLILQVMHKCNWNKHEAARLLSITRSTLYSKLKRYDLRPH